MNQHGIVEILKIIVSNPTKHVKMFTQIINTNYSI